jgi:NAD-dependent dihydropyrimidine dehydrogenase PreA subunit
MFRLPGKFVATFLLLWLPLFGSSALAASISMQLHGACHDMAMTAVQHQGTAGHQHTNPYDSSSCNDCGVCHLACSGYLVSPSFEPAAPPRDGQVITLGQVSFTSVIVAPLDPPPLARS